MQEHETIQTTAHCDVDDVGFGLSQSSTSRLKAVDGTEHLGTSHGSETTIATVGETKQLSEEYEDSDAEVGNDFSSGISTSVNDQSDHIFRDFQPHQYTTKILQRQRVLHGFKVACAVLLASQFVLIDSLNAQLKGTGNWVVITVVIVTLQTPGDTLHKILNRTAGTLVAAVLALLVGMLGRLMSESIPPAGQVFIAITNFLGAFLGTWLSSQVGKWYYAFLLGTITYVFITLSVLQEGSSVAFFRVLMIIVGGIIGLLVAWLPPECPSVRSGPRVFGGCIG
ncbi:malate transmembrane transporter [Fragilaria crotonensis]|nr:malate transmembrane transporter [Fragilaria crotonensis]